MGIDYYGVLQIQRISTENDIKKAYRNLALEFHPEKLKLESSQKVFALIGEAYDILSNPLHRAIFDQYGEEGLKRGVPLSNTEYYQPYHYHGKPMRTYKYPPILFLYALDWVFSREFFGTHSPYANLLDYLQNPPIIYSIKDKDGFLRNGICKKQESLRHVLKVNLHEVFFGGIKKMKIHRLVYVDEERNKTEVKEKILTVPIKPGIKTGTEITFNEEGDQNPTQIPADIIFIIDIVPHETFTREDDNLVMFVDITLEEALLGTTITVNTIDHRLIRVPITDVVHPGYEKIVEFEGMPIVEKYPQRGDLIIRFNIIFPKYLCRESKNIIKRGFQQAQICDEELEAVNKMILTEKIMSVSSDEQMPPHF